MTERPTFPRQTARIIFVSIGPSFQFFISKFPADLLGVFEGEFVLAAEFTCLLE